MFRWRATFLAVLYCGDCLIFSSVQPFGNRSILGSSSWSTSGIGHRVTAQLGTLEGYAFREVDGGPPMRPLTVELIDQGRTQYRRTTRADGTFSFHNVREGHYTIRGRFGDFIVAQDAVMVMSGEKNFTAVMLPKRRAGTLPFRAVTADQLAGQSDRNLEKKQRQAMNLAAKGDWSGAARLYEQAAVAGAQPVLWDSLGLVYLQMGKEKEAFAAFEKAIEQDPKYLLSYARLETVYLEKRQYEEVLAVTNRALAIDPKWLTAHVFLGEAQAGRGDLNAALRSAETACELARGRAAGPYFLLAKIRWARRDCDEARRQMERYLELNTSARRRPDTLKLLEKLQACQPVP
jgi:tetratricopeptide (TPR) repeat protein